jgi:hypothetical protein
MISYKINHKALVIGLVVGCLIVLACSTSRTSTAATAAPVVNIAENKCLDFTVVNKSGEEIHQIYMGPGVVEDWTDREILKGKMLGIGGSTPVTFGPSETVTMWDIKVVYDMDNRAVIVRDVDVSRFKTLTIVQNNGKTSVRYN